MLTFALQTQRKQFTFLIPERCGQFWVEDEVKAVKCTAGWSDTEPDNINFDSDFIVFIKRMMIKFKYIQKGKGAGGGQALKKWDEWQKYVGFNHEDIPRKAREAFVNKLGYQVAQISQKWEQAGHYTVVGSFDVKPKTGGGRKRAATPTVESPTKRMKISGFPDTPSKRARTTTPDPAQGASNPSQASGDGTVKFKQWVITASEKSDWDGTLLGQIPLSEKTASLAMEIMYANHPPTDVQANKIGALLDLAIAAKSGNPS